MGQPPEAIWELDSFTEWVATHYQAIADARDGFDMILERVEGDEKKAYDEFFALLPSYINDRQEIGTEGVRLKFSEVQDKLWEAFGKKAEP